MKRKWYHHELKGYRSTGQQGTYVSFDYGSLLPLPRPERVEEFRWLRRLMGKDYEPFIPEAEFLQMVSRVEREADELGILLPRAYKVLVEDKRIRYSLEQDSITACYFSHFSSLLPVPQKPGEYLLHFYTDQQFCCFWYIHISGGKELGILISETLYGGREEDFGYTKMPTDLEEFEWVSPNLSSFFF